MGLTTERDVDQSELSHNPRGNTCHGDERGEIKWMEENLLRWDSWKDNQLSKCKMKEYESLKDRLMFARIERRPFPVDSNVLKIRSFMTKVHTV